MRRAHEPGHGGAGRARVPSLWLACLVLAVAACTEVGTPDRPSGVPAEAFFVGGVDGGVFVQIRALGPGSPDLYHATVYGDSDGSTWYEGALRLDPAGGVPVDVSNESLFEAWNGEAVLLVDGRRLVAVESH